MTPYERPRLPWLLALVLTLMAVSCMRRPTNETGTKTTESAGIAAPAPNARAARAYVKPADGELRKKLTPLEYEVTQHDATEPPFANGYWDNHEEGLYVDVASGEPLFSSRDKFDSGTGWPSFSRPVEQARVVSREDRSHGRARTEVRSRDGDSHLGHVFDDGPAPSGLRYCINSASLRFVPVSRLAAEGYAEYLPLFGVERSAGTAAAANHVERSAGTAAAANHVERSAGTAAAASASANSCNAPLPGEQPGCEPTLEAAVLAGGCFWGMEEILRKIPGIVATEVGYAGGRANVKYEDVRSGETGNAESVRIVFDPQKLSYEDLLEKWFFRMHDPTTLDRQGNDVGSQYRSAIFVSSPEQRAAAERVKKRIDTRGEWKRPLVTQIVDAGAFTRAEGYHQRYLEKNPGGYSCHYLRDFPKVP